MATTRRHRTLFALVVVPSVVVAVSMSSLYFVVLPLFPSLHHYYFTQSTATYATYRLAILGHILCASVALVVGPVNLYNALRGGRRRWHRHLGGVYAVAASTAAVFAVFMSFHAYAGTLPAGRVIVTSGFFTLGCVWLTTVYAAVRAIAVDRDRDRHAFWMIISISTTYSAVVFRVFNTIIIALGKFDLLYPLLGWLGWIPSVCVGLVIARRHHARTTGARRSTPARVPAGAGPFGRVPARAFPDRSGVRDGDDLQHGDPQ